MTKRIGPSMQRAIAYVASHEGCHMIGAAMHASPMPTSIVDRNWALGYNPVHRAIASGKISAYPSLIRSGAYQLYVTGSKAEINRRKGTP